MVGGFPDRKDTVDKEILVISVDTIARSFGFVGVDPDVEDSVYEEIDRKGKWMLRSEAETSPDHKQIIPFVLITSSHENGAVVLGAVRLDGGNDSRLHGRVTIGLGGHVAKTGEAAPSEAIKLAVLKEIEEETGIRVPWKHFKFIGFVNDDSDDVGSVHYGFVYHLQVSPGPEWTLVRSQEPDKLRLFWAAPKAMGLLHDRLEGWAKLMLLSMGSSQPAE